MLGARCWVLVGITSNSKRREIGLGGYSGVTLANARPSPDKMRKEVAEGLDPIEEKAKLAPRDYAFTQCATDCIALHCIEILESKYFNNTPDPRYITLAFIVRFPLERLLAINLLWVDFQ